MEATTSTAPVVETAALRAGCARSYEELDRRYRGRMLAVANGILHDAEESQDAVQDALLSASQKIDGFRESSRISTWLHRIVVNAALMRRRRISARPEVRVDDLLPTFDEQGSHARPVEPWCWDGERALLREERRALVRSCIEMLPDRYRMVLMLRDVEERDVREVAERLGITPNAVKIRSHRARQALAALLRDRLRDVATTAAA